MDYDNRCDFRVAPVFCCWGLFVKVFKVVKVFKDPKDFKDFFRIFAK